MFVGYSSNNRVNRTGSMKELSNVDYYKRYIIIEVPENNNIMCNSNITVINISSSTGKGLIGRYSSAERRQNYIIYYGIGNVFLSIPEIITKEISNCINYNSTICMNDVSYGAHLYNLNKPKFSELMTITSYNDIYDNMFNHKHDISETIPYPKFYNFEHHILNEDVLNNNIPFGNDLSSNNTYITFRELIDDHTYIYITRNSNFKSLTSENIIYEKDLDFSIDNIATMIIGPVTNLMTGLLVNELSFCYDINDTKSKMSKIKYKTDHKQPNSIYMEQISGNYLSQFEQDMCFVKDCTNTNFTLFVHCMIGNIKLRFLKYDVKCGYIKKDFNFNIGVMKKQQHQEAVNWMRSPLY